MTNYPHEPFKREDPPVVLQQPHHNPNLPFYQPRPALPAHDAVPSYHQQQPPLPFAAAATGLQPPPSFVHHQPPAPLGSHTHSHQSLPGAAGLYPSLASLTAPSAFTVPHPDQPNAASRTAGASHTLAQYSLQRQATLAAAAASGQSHRLAATHALADRINGSVAQMTLADRPPTTDMARRTHSYDYLPALRKGPTALSRSANRSSDPHRYADTSRKRAAIVTATSNPVVHATTLANGTASMAASGGDVTMTYGDLPGEPRPPLSPGSAMHVEHSGHPPAAPAYGYVVSTDYHDPYGVQTYETAYGHFATTAAPTVPHWNPAANYLPSLPMLQPPAGQYLPTFHSLAYPGQHGAHQLPNYQPLMLPPPSPNILSYYNYDPYRSAARRKTYRPQPHHHDYFEAPPGTCVVREEELRPDGAYLSSPTGYGVPAANSNHGSHALSYPYSPAGDLAGNVNSLAVAAAAAASHLQHPALHPGGDPHGAAAAAAANLSLASGHLATYNPSLAAALAAGANVPPDAVLGYGPAVQASYGLAMAAAAVAAQGHQMAALPPYAHVTQAPLGSAYPAAGATHPHHLHHSGGYPPSGAAWSARAAAAASATTPQAHSQVGLGITLPAAGLPMTSSVSVPVSHPAYLPGTHVTFSDARQDVVRDQCLAHAHTLYAADAQSDVLLALLQTLHELHPTHLPTLLLLACVHFSRKEPKLSLHYNHRILELDANYVEAMSNIGTTLRGMGRASEAETYWWRAVRRRPGYWDAVENLLGVLCSPASSSPAKDSTAATSKPVAGETTETNLTRPTGPRYSEALQVCDYVESNLVQPSGDPRLPLSHHVPAHQLPRLQNLFYVKGNLRFALGDVSGARTEYGRALEVVLNPPAGNAGMTVGHDGPTTLEQAVCATVRFGAECGGFTVGSDRPADLNNFDAMPLILIDPARVAQLLRRLFPATDGVLPALAGPSGKPLPASVAQQANQTTSTILLTLAKLFQDHQLVAHPLTVVLPLHYLSLALNPSPSTCNNLGIYLNNLPTPPTRIQLPGGPNGAGLSASASTGVAYALQFYTYGLSLDSAHPHLYTNLGSLFKDMGYLHEAVKMYERAVECNPKFDVAYANLGNAVKDMGRVQDSVRYYLRAVEENPDFVDALCGLANALSGVCDWRGRTGTHSHVLPLDPTLVDLRDEHTAKLYHMMAAKSIYLASPTETGALGWMDKVVAVVHKQLADGQQWGRGTLLTSSLPANQASPGPLETFLAGILAAFGPGSDAVPLRLKLNTWYTLLQRERAGEPTSDTDRAILQYLHAGVRNEGGWIVRVLERTLRWVQRRWYLDLYHRREHHSHTDSSADGPSQSYARPAFPALPVPPVPTVLPFHTFTYPLDGRQVRLISHRNGLRISHAVLTAPWLPATVYRPPPPPAPHLRLGYVSSDFNNHPLAHLMQSVFGFHDRTRFQVICYATTASDGSPYREKIEREADVFLDVSAWSMPAILERINQDQIHVLINLNGYTKGARNELFAARPCPVQVSYMGFAGTLGAQWTDWFVTDPIVCPHGTVQAERWTTTRGDQVPGKVSGATDQSAASLVAGLDEGELDPEEDSDAWVYTERMIYMPHSYFVDDHRQGFREKDDDHLATQPGEGPSAPTEHLSEPQREARWLYEQDRRWAMRRELFPTIPDDWFIFTNFNQLYKIDPVVFRLWLRILGRVPHSILWLLNFPAAGRDHLLRTACTWHPQDPTVAQRIIFTDVAPKEVHIHRGRVADLFLDTPECNGHTTAVDILWSGTPLLTWPRHRHKLCSRVAASVALATGAGEAMIVETDHEYEERAVQLATSQRYEYVPRATADPSSGPQPPPIIATVAASSAIPPTLSANPAGIEAYRHSQALMTQYHRVGHGPAMDLRRHLFMFRDSNRLFDTPRWTRNLERGYLEAWRRWETGEDQLYSQAELDAIDPALVTPEARQAAVDDRAQRASGTAGPVASGGTRGSIWVQDEDDGATSARFCASREAL
ncbi:hypothetical protein IWQ60_003589 [Tieghemiomyces parasiticus]|uniref:protein O-GlcNAc transferase n=1 Tax=Tieghemiomyces parasiticus TaxID=78921 RepID=A0A9W8DUN2_9FUNG|nr:hypothetical protein IWQ60_003589 [Tieghemiomyces parasiticus]